MLFIFPIVCGVKSFATFFWNLSKEHLCSRKKQQLNIWYSYDVVQGCNKGGGWPLLQLTSNSTRGSDPRLHQGTFKLDIRKNSFSERVVRPWPQGLGQGSSGVTLPGSVQKPCSCGLWRHNLVMNMAVLVNNCTQWLWRSFPSVAVLWPVPPNWGQTCWLLDTSFLQTYLLSLSLALIMKLYIVIFIVELSLINFSEPKIGQKNFHLLSKKKAIAD